MRVTASRILICLAAILVVGGAVFATQAVRYYSTLRNSPKPPGDQFVTVYMQTSAAAKKRQGGEFWMPLRENADAYLRLYALRESHPTWQPQIVKFRLAKIRSELIGQTLTSVGLPTPTPGSAPTTPIRPKKAPAFKNLPPEPSAREQYRRRAMSLMTTPPPSPAALEINR